MIIKVTKELFQTFLRGDPSYLQAADEHRAIHFARPV